MLEIRTAEMDEGATYAVSGDLLNSTIEILLNLSHQFALSEEANEDTIIDRSEAGHLAWIAEDLSTSKRVRIVEK